MQADWAVQMACGSDRGRPQTSLAAGERPVAVLARWQS